MGDPIAGRARVTPESIGGIGHPRTLHKTLIYINHPIPITIKNTIRKGGHTGTTSKGGSKI